jgi:hypothetical protein
MSEVKSIPGFPGYTVSDQGVVRGPNGETLSPRTDKDGYMRVDLRLNGKRYTRFVHTLVSLAFHGSAKEVDHKDGNRTKDTASNLEPVSHQENMKRMAEHNGKDAVPYKKSK